ncbi:hypothetical protein SUNI508_10912 [Seiridium unicorne]|uniref:Carboxylic ester hydrolase n=1 Tax=Seiridium unicorne TaxID=138068 RepID=A0ABR2UK98_9PEZI
MRSFTLFRSMAALLLAPGCNAALTSVADFGDNPTNLEMQIYLPSFTAAVAQVSSTSSKPAMPPTQMTKVSSWYTQRPITTATAGMYLFPMYATGSSSGCMMTNVLLAVYPDVFAAGSCYSGVAAGCFAGSSGNSPITSNRTCANGNVNKSGAEWAAQVHVMYPSYNGTYPHM